MSTVLRDCIAFSRDGEWGKAEPFEGSVLVGVIRGTDFDAVRQGAVDALPQRFIPKHIFAYKQLQPDDILIETAGGSKDRPTGRTLYIKPSTIARARLPLICASFSRSVRLDINMALPRFVYWQLQYLYSSGALRQFNTQHTGVSRFTCGKTRRCRYL